MQAVFARSTVMRYQDQDLQYEIENADQAATDDHERSSRKQYRLKRSMQSTRRALRASGLTQPSLGMAGRRKRRWSW